MVMIQVSDNTNGTKADLKRGQGGVSGALTSRYYDLYRCPFASPGLSFSGG